MAGLIAEMRATAAQVEAERDLSSIGPCLTAVISALEQASAWMLHAAASDPAAALAESFNFMMLTGYTCGGWHLARAAQFAAQTLAKDPMDAFCQAKIATASFYAEQILPKTAALLTMIRAGESHARNLPAERF